MRGDSAVGAEGHAVHLAVWPTSVEQPLAGGRVQTRTALSDSPEAMRLPSGLKATPLTPAVMALEVRGVAAGGRVPDPHRPVRPAEASRLPSGLNATPRTAPVDALEVRGPRGPSAASQTRTVPSVPPRGERACRRG